MPGLGFVTVHHMPSSHDAAAATEVEVKYQVFDAAAVVEALRMRQVVLSEPVHQDDQAYAPQWWTYGQSKIGVPFARMRTQQGRHLFTVKKPVDNELSCLEHECEVSDREQMHHALRSMGFHPTVRIVKTRRTARVGALSLCLDDIDQLGVYLEVEQLITDGQCGRTAQQHLHRFVQALGIAVRPVSDTYDSLVRAAQHVG